MSLAERQRTSAIESAVESKRVTHCIVAATSIILEDGVVLAVQAIPINVTKRLDKLDPQGLPVYDVNVQLRVNRVPPIEAPKGHLDG